MTNLCLNRRCALVHRLPQPVHVSQWLFQQHRSASGVVSEFKVARVNPLFMTAQTVNECLPDLIPLIPFGFFTNRPLSLTLVY